MLALVVGLGCHAEKRQYLPGFKGSADVAKVTHQIGIDGSVDRVFAALTTNEGLAGWWASSADVDLRVGGRIALAFDGLTVLYFAYRAIEEHAKVAIECTDGPDPWSGSALVFELIQADRQVLLRLTHRNDAAGEDDFLYFRTKWVCYLLSLKALIETGKGRPYPDDIKIHVGD